MTLLAVAAILALVALTGSVLYAARAFSRPSVVVAPLPDSQPTTKQLMEFNLSLEQNEKDILDLKLAVDEGIRRVDRAEKRVQKTVSSARRLVRESGLEHAGIEAEYDELQSGDGEPSESSEVLPVHDEVASDAPTGIPGMSMGELQRIREARYAATLL